MIFLRLHKNEVNMGRGFRRWILQLAFDEARKSASLQFRHASVLVMGKKIVNIAHNSGTLTTVHRTKITTFGSRPPRVRTRHSEIAVCVGVHSSVLRKCSLYNIRVLATGEVVISRPCKMCREYLSRVGVKKVYYTD